jgi:chemotaxis protein methyltransferase CheR
MTGDTAKQSTYPLEPGTGADTTSITQLEQDLLLDAVARRYGYDFRQYANPVLQRRLKVLQRRMGVKHLSELIPGLLYQPEILQQLLQALSVTVTEFFRDPEFFQAFRTKVAPLLHTYPFISFWCAGCATGQEAYSWAIALQEEGLLDRTRIYATDINDGALNEAREGVYSDKHYQLACANYQKMGGQNHFEDYCQQSYGAIKMHESLQHHITFARHNLVHDGVFGEMMVISCRNVMIYFNETLKNRCMELFIDSLDNQGFLCLGESEAIVDAHINHQFNVRDTHNRIYQRIAPCVAGLGHL